MKLALTSIAALAISGCCLLVGNGNNEPKYARHTHQTTPQTQAIFLEPPTVDQIKQDLSGKTVIIGGKNHKFSGPELNYMNILTTNQTQEGGLVVDVQICADSTIVNRRGLLGIRKTYTHENVCGSVRVYYERRNGAWSYRMAENIDLQKTLVPNHK